MSSICLLLSVNTLLKVGLFSQLHWRERGQLFFFFFLRLNIQLCVVFASKNTIRKKTRLNRILKADIVSVFKYTQT